MSVVLSFPSVDSTTSLLARPCNDIDLCAVFEDTYESSSILLRGNDTSGLHRPLLFQITKIPLHGKLFDKRNISLLNGSIIEGYATYPYVHGIHIKYKGPKDFFTFPPHNNSQTNNNNNNNNNNTNNNTWITESFEFRVIAPTSDGFMEKGASIPVIQEIYVINVNDPPIINATSLVEEEGVSTFNSFSWGNECEEELDATHSNKDSFISVYGSCIRPFKNVKVIDPDKDVDFVRVDIHATIGLLSLNDLGMTLSEFSSCNEMKNSSWQCKGSGSSDPAMTFVAKGNDLNPILSGVQYETLLQGNDIITLTIYDGVGNDCIPIAEHARRTSMDTMSQQILFSNQNECFVVSHQFPIQAKKYRNQNATGKSLAIVPFHLWVALAGGISLLVFLAWKFNVHLIPKVIIKNSLERIKVFRSNMKQYCGRFNFEEETIVFQSENCDNKSQCKNDDDDDDREVWTEYLDDASGDYYYESSKTRRVTWTKPQDFCVFTEDNQDQKSQDESKDLSSRSDNSMINNEKEPEWVQYLDEATGDHYYKNVKTRRVTWTKPNESVFVVD